MTHVQHNEIIVRFHDLQIVNKTWPHIVNIK